MDPVEFVKAIKIQTSDASVVGTASMIESPAGRNPSDRLMWLSAWYNGLSDLDRSMVIEMMRESAEQAIFSFFCILDGVKVFEREHVKGDLELYYVKGKERLLLNDPMLEELHNVYKGITSNNATSTPK